MPVELTKGSRLKSNNGSSESLGYGKVGRIDNGYGPATTGNLTGLLLGQVVGVGGVPLNLAVW